MTSHRPEMTLRERRALPKARAFDAEFHSRSPHFWPIVPAARLFDGAAWPGVEGYGRVFRGDAPVAFHEVTPLPRRHRRDGSPVDPSSMYDARIVLERRVPTRARSWHDFLNALVWGTFPRAKWALHARQHRALAAHVPAGATRLPDRRTRELDALALIDEGGVVVLAKKDALASLGAASIEDLLRRDGDARGMIFGHALYEGLALDTRAMAARAFVAEVSDLPRGRDEAVRIADESLAAALASRALAPEDLPRVPLAALPTRGAW